MQNGRNASVVRPLQLNYKLQLNLQHTRYLVDFYNI